MTDKLTCKMSDGTEWQVDEPPQKQSYLKDLGGGLFQEVTGYRFTVSPIEREPREYWIVKKPGGEKVIFEYEDWCEARKLTLSSYAEVLHVREVLEDEK